MLGLYSATTLSGLLTMINKDSSLCKKDICKEIKKYLLRYKNEASYLLDKNTYQDIKNIYYEWEADNFDINHLFLHADKSSLLHIAAKWGHEKVANCLVKEGADVNLQNERGMSPLHLAAEYKHVNVAKLLLENDEKKANVNVQCKCWRETPLHLAVRARDLKMMNLLLNNGAKIDSQNQGGATPLHIAFRNNFLKGMKLLIEKGADQSFIHKSEAEDVGISIGTGMGCVAAASGGLLLWQSGVITVPLVFAVIGSTIAFALITGCIAYGITYATSKYTLSSKLKEVDLTDFIQGQQITL
ncbi:ankyrin repeat domain-containing protein [Wolbachia endosymbiont of Pentalonia nigronervosa]|uniref:ankyrin repeat domain-containing protein n=1 Tax=Wolbachia endosymbiont of Pentalonia nigronervosa TaxID=1301914 RepID=UPI00165ED1B6|nr:ankyrin repeat domain-containing protein [Wolbachia endosymbiont of Pentalonia nigronervosa]MBD0391624.1 ankyrin repeat domain-containing protein [Wolbachia endosymbiont of Pentalonia nigronervosa]